MARLSGAKTRYVTGFASEVTRTMPGHRHRPPSLRRHKPSEQAVVTLSGHDHYLGPWPASEKKAPAEAQQAYDRLIAEWLANGRQLPGHLHDPRQPSGPSVETLIAAFWKHAELHYRRADGTVTHELDDYRLSLRPLRHLYSKLPAEEFSPLKLKAVRGLMVQGYEHPKYGPQPSLARGVVNQRVGRIVRVFKWAVAEEMVPESVHRALKAVPGLQQGRTEARETEPVKPVAEEYVEATLPFLLPPVRGMVQLQQFTGMRPGEVTSIRACDIDMSGPVWLYRPPQHKMRHRGKQRVVAIGPQAQEVIKPYLTLDTQAHLFSPRRAMEEFRAVQRAGRKTKVQPSQQDRRKERAKKRPGEHYTSRSYAQAIAKACVKADRHAREEAMKAGMPHEEAESRVFVPHWHPNQLRHAHATEVRRRYGLEAAQVALGHAQANVTQVYAERDLALAAKVAAEIG
jgi:integrase